MFTFTRTAANSLKLSALTAVLPALTLLISATSAPSAQAIVSQQVQNNTRYVSRRSVAIDKSLRDGQTWDTAYADFNEVQFPQEGGSFTIYVDGGGDKMRYNHGLKVPANVNLNLLQGTDTAHQGVVELNGTANSEADGIAINSTGTVNIGRPTANNLLSQKPIIIRGFNHSGIHVNSGAGRVTVYGALVGANNGVGVWIQGGTTVRVNQSMIRNNATNVLINSASTGGTYTFDRDWIYRSSYTNETSFGVRIVSAAGGQVSMTTSAIGPGLNQSFVNSSAADIRVVHCLLNDAQGATFNLTDRPHSMIIDHVTSFMTSTNADGNGAYCFKSTDRPDGTVKVTNSVIYDGTVGIPAESVGYAADTNNFQFRIHGVKTFFAPTQTDPKFANTALSKLPPATSPGSLAKLNFDLADDSPAKAAGAGSALTSVQQLQPPQL